MIFNPYRRLLTSFNFSPPSPSHGRAADAWLHLAFGRAGLLPDAGALPERYRTDPSARHAQRILALGQILLQRWRIPAFAPARLVKLLPQISRAGSVRCDIEQPAIDALPVQAYQNAYLVAADLCAWCCGTEAAGDPAPFHAQFQNVVERTRPPFDLGGDSTVPVLGAAHAQGIPFFHLGRGMYQIGLGAKGRLFHRGHGGGDAYIGALLSGSKSAAARLLDAQLLPVPRHHAVSSAAAAEAASLALGFPVVIKPDDGNRGEGVTVGVDRRDGVAKAFASARQNAPGGRVLVERQAAGMCHRLVIVRGTLLYCVKRLPLFVTGDGASSLHDLIGRGVAHDLAQPYWLRSKMANFDAHAISTLAAGGLPPASVPRHGERIYLRPIETTAWGGLDEDLTERTHPDNVIAAVNAARALDLEVAGIDMISEDITVSWRDNGAVINEVNGGPLLGGGDVSRRNLARFLDIFLGGGGMIPIEHCDGGSARRRQGELLAKGIRCWLVHDTAAIDPTGRSTLHPQSGAEGFDHRGSPAHVLSSPLEDGLRRVALNRDLEHLVISSGPLQPV